MPEDLKTPDQSRMLRWQGITLVTLFSGYAGYYICRSNLSVATTLIVEDSALGGITKAQIGQVASIGVTLYALGKITNGVTADYIGGRRMFLLGMFASAACTVLFGLLSGLTAFAIVWAINRYVQS